MELEGDLPDLVGDAVLARRVVDAHGGTIEVTSELGEGTTARVSLPFAS